MKIIFLYGSMPPQTRHKYKAINFSTFAVSNSNLVSSAYNELILKILAVLECLMIIQGWVINLKNIFLPFRGKKCGHLVSLKFSDLSTFQTRNLYDAAHFGGKFFA